MEIDEKVLRDLTEEIHILSEKSDVQALTVQVESLEEATGRTERGVSVLTDLVNRCVAGRAEDQLKAQKEEADYRLDIEKELGVIKRNTNIFAAGLLGIQTVVAGLFGIK